MSCPIRTALACMLLALGAQAVPAQTTDYPTLRPIDELLTGTGQGRLSEAGGSDLLGRAERLRRRAAVLRDRAVFDAETRARLAALQARTGG